MTEVARAPRTVAPDFSPLERAIFASESVYREHGLDDARVEWIAQAAEHHAEACPEYRRVAERARFDPDELRRTGDLASVPLLSTGIFKRRRVVAAGTEAALECVSSGTQGSRSVVVRDRKTLDRFVGGMLAGVKEFWGHGDARTAYLLSPPPEEDETLWLSYVLGLTEALYEARYAVAGGRLDAPRLYELLADAGDEQPVLVGTPPLFADFARWLRDSGRRLDLGARDAVAVTAGGWKRRAGEQVDRAELAAALEAMLGVRREQVRDAFNMVELNSILFECERGRKHAPPWLAVIARDPGDFSPVRPGEEGILTFLDPTATSYPCFLLGDDFGAVADGCGCGRAGTVVSIVRRLSTIETRGCAAKTTRYAAP